MKTDLLALRDDAGNSTKTREFFSIQKLAEILQFSLSHMFQQCDLFYYARYFHAPVHELFSMFFPLMLFIRNWTEVIAKKKYTQ